ncbi:MAG: hypothetical protein U0791_23165 [Gemmataceae bacterium]
MVAPIHRPSRSPFDSIRQVEENPNGTEFEYWSARDAQVPLGYSRWENMENVIRKAKAACRNARQLPGGPGARQLPPR